MPEHSSETIQKSYSLSQLAENLSAQIQKIYPTRYWIRAEIGKLNFYPQSGHAYPQLLEKKDGKIVADIRGFIPRTTFLSISERFTQISGKPLSDGMKVMLLSKLSYHPIYGLSLQISDIDPSYTLGEMARMRQEALLKLRSSGLFGLNKQQRIPTLIQNLAIISVETSKGYRDFKEVIDRSPYKDCVNATLYSALLQGDAAVTSIQKALEKIKLSEIEYDAVAIIRGGGGETGLDCFDQYDLAKAVCEMPLPVISGIGHATNLTVVEQVSNQSFLTPTHLAQFIVEGYLAFQERIKVAGQKLKGIKSGKLVELGISLQRQAMKLEQSIEFRQNREKTYINSLRSSLQLNGQELMQKTGMQLDILVKNQMDRAIERKINKAETNLVRLKPILPQVLSSHLSGEQNRLKFINQKIQILDPINTLKRGFSITRKNGKPILNSSAVHEGDELTTELWDGSINSIVKKKNGED